MPSALARSHLIVPVVCALSLACASASSSSSGYQAPRLASRTDVPILSTSTSSAASRAPFRVEIQVEVDPNGRADVSTLKLTGPGALESRGALESWIATSTFQPARQNGVPVRGLFKMTIERRTTVQVRRR